MGRPSRVWLLMALVTAAGQACSPSRAPEARPSAGVATIPLLPASSTPLGARPRAAERTPAVDCPPRESLAEASRDLREANDLIARAGEHPSDSQLSEILPRLRRAAYAGDLEAQRRFGYYVVGYYYTDEIFWPDEPEIAIPALAMLRVAARRNPDPTDALLVVLGHNPVVFADPDGPSALPEEWLEAALLEAKHWEDCTISPATPSRYTGE
jgi:hypothetical protein